MQVALGFHTVQADRFLDGRGVDGNQPALVGDAKKEYVHGHVAGKEAFRDAAGVHENITAGLRVGVDHINGTLGSGETRQPAHHITGRGLGRVDDGHCTGRMSALEVILRRRAQKIEAEQEIGVAPAYFGRSFNGLFADDDARDHGAAFLREAGLVERENREAVDPGGGGEQRIHGQHAGAADPGSQNRVAAAGRYLFPGLGHCHFRKLRQRFAFEPRAKLEIHGDKRRTIAEQTGIILVARGLVNAGLLAVRRFHRIQADAIGLAHAVATALADFFVDHQTQRRLGELAARTQAAFLGRALLVVDDDADTWDLLQLPEHGGKIIAMAKCGIGGELGRAVFFQIVGDYDRFAHALGFELARKIGNGERSSSLLAARHGDRGVVENLVSDVDARRYAGGDGHGPRVEVRAVADVLKNVMAIDEGRHADPGRALTAHVGEERIAAAQVRELRGHGMTAYAAAGDLAFQQQRGAIVRAAGAESGMPD